MFFSKLRNNMRWVIIFIAVTFALGGLYVGVGGVGTRTTDTSPALAQVNGQTISEAQFQRAYMSNVQFYSQFFGPVQGQMLEEVMYASLQDLITDALVRDAAKAAALPVSKAEIDEELAELKAGFPDDGTYRRALAQSGLTEKQLRELIKEDLSIQKLEQSVRARATLADEELEGLDEDSVAALRRSAEDQELRLWLDDLREKATIAIHHAQLQARDLAVQGRWEDAAEQYRVAMVEDPFNPYLHVSLASVYEQLERPEDALAEYEAALSLNEGDPMLHVLLGFAYREAGREEDGAEQLRLAGDLNPWDPQLQLLLLQTFTEMGLFEDALEAAARLDELERLQAELDGASGVQFDVLEEDLDLEAAGDDGEAPSVEPEAVSEDEVPADEGR